jgi:hypothetical protein
VIPTSKPRLSSSFPIPFFHTIGGTNKRNNTDDLGLFAPKVGVGSPPTPFPFPIHFLATIDGTNNEDNTDDVGLFAPKVGVDSPKRVRYYFHSEVTFLMSVCYLKQNLLDCPALFLLRLRKRPSIHE